MGLFSKTEKPKPVPFHSGAIAPMGSLGEEWEGKMEFPVDPVVIQQQTDQAVRERERRLADPKSFEFAGKVRFRPPLGWLAIHAWGALVLGLLSTGPLFPARLLLLGAAVVLGIVGWSRLRNRVELERGHRRAMVAALIAAGILVWEGASRFLTP